MPVNIPNTLPARAILEKENIFVMSEERATHQDIRPLQVAILNLMPTKIKTETYPGVSIFMRLPGRRDGVEIFDDMLTTSRSLARELDGELLDEQGSSLSVQRERYLREEVIQFEHQTVS